MEDIRTADPAEYEVLCMRKWAQIVTCFCKPYLCFAFMLFGASVGSLIYFFHVGRTTVAVGWLIGMAILICAFVPFIGTRPGRRMDPCLLAGATDDCSPFREIQKRAWPRFTACSCLWGVVFGLMVLFLLTGLYDASDDSGDYFLMPLWRILDGVVFLVAFFVVACLIPTWCACNIQFTPERLVRNEEEGEQILAKDCPAIPPLGALSAQPQEAPPTSDANEGGVQTSRV